MGLNGTLNPGGKSQVKLTREVHWKSGKWGVVAGPFPHAFFRSETRDTVAKASKCPATDCMTRGETTRDDQYAKVLLADINEIHGGENEWGDVSP